MNDAPSSDDTEDRDAARRFTELRQLVARIQHEVNNPLAALLAEAQLLSLEPGLEPEQRAAAQRMVDLVRRVVAAMRKFDEARGDAVM